MEIFLGETAEELRELIDNKNSVELEYRLDQLGVDSALREKAAGPAGLFGGQEVLEKAQALSGNAACAAALDNLEAVYQLPANLAMKISVPGSGDAA